MSGERRLVTRTDAGEATLRTVEMVFDQSGGAGNSVVTGATPNRRAVATVTFVGMWISLTTAGSSSTTVVLYKDGIAVTGATVTLAAGESYKAVVFPVPVRCRARVSVFSVVCTVAGTAAKGLAGALEQAA